jgi:hypothetical protein
VREDPPDSFAVASSHKNLFCEAQILVAAEAVVSCLSHYLNLTSYKMIQVDEMNRIARKRQHEARIAKR